MNDVFKIQVDLLEVGWFCIGCYTQHSYYSSLSSKMLVLSAISGSRDAVREAVMRELLPVGGIHMDGDDHQPQPD